MSYYLPQPMLFRPGQAHPAMAFRNGPVAGPGAGHHHFPGCPLAPAGGVGGHHARPREGSRPGGPMGPGAPSGAGGPSRARGRDPRYDFRGGMIPRQIYGGHFEYIGNAREMGAVPLPGYSWGPQAKPGDVGRYLDAMEEEDRRRAGRRHGGARGPSRAGHPSRGGRPSRGGQKGERGGGNGTRGEGHLEDMDDLGDAMDDMHISGSRGGSRARPARKNQASGLRRRQQDVRGQRRQHAQHAQQVLQGVRR